MVTNRDFSSSPTIYVGHMATGTYIVFGSEALCRDSNNSLSYLRADAPRDTPQPRIRMLA